MAFQPIVDVSSGRTFAHEALVRGADGRAASSVLGAVSEQNRYAFDQACRVKAIELAGGLGLAHTGERLSINFLPNAVYTPQTCIRATLAAAQKVDFPLTRIIFEFSESERLDIEHLLSILNAYRDFGFKTALDDFGAHFAGVGVLARFQPDYVKFDINVIRDVDKDRAKRAIVSHCVRMFRDLAIEPVGEGVETYGEYSALRDLGVTLMQGFFFARPIFEGFAEPRWELSEVSTSGAPCPGTVNCG